MLRRLFVFAGEEHKYADKNYKLITMVEEVQPKNTKKQKKEYIFAAGRRKEAVARVRLYKTV